MPDPLRSCHTCIWYKPQNTQIGRCHRFPPQRAFFLAPAQGGKTIAERENAQFPIVPPFEFCGEWRVRVTIN